MYYCNITSKNTSEILQSYEIRIERTYDQHDPYVNSDKKNTLWIIVNFTQPLNELLQQGPGKHMQGESKIF